MLNPSERKLVDTSKVSPGETIAGVSAVALFIFLFLPWYGIDSVGGFAVGDLGGNLSAWEAFDFVDILLFLVAVAVIALVLARAADAMPQLPQPPALIIAAAGGLALVLILFRLLVTPDFGTADVDVDRARQVGIFLGLLAAAGIAYGGWRAMNEPVAAAPGSRSDRGVPPTPRPSTPPSSPVGDTPPPTGGSAPPAGGRSAPPDGSSTPPAGTAPPAGSSAPPPGPPSGGQTPQQ